VQAKVKRALQIKKEALGKKAAKIKWPEGCMEGTYPRPKWLPPGWLHGVKVGTYGYSGRGLQVFISPDRQKRYYHQVCVEEYVGKKLTRADGVPPTFEELLAQTLHRVPVVKFGQFHENSMFKCLSLEERAKLPKAKDIHFCVISARRTSELASIRSCMIVQESFKAAGITPRWYVDKKSLESYRRLGFDAVFDGGSLCSARNKALDDAKKLGKACCECSDDIRKWWYYSSLDHSIVKGDEDEANRIARSARPATVSPVAAARFMLARMRADPQKPKLGGVLPNTNVARGLSHASVSHKNFILGDFFVSDVGSTVRFDRKLTLKEDYDFTASHVAKYGCVLRFNRMVLDVAHYTNVGGAVAYRNAAEEQKNIKILKRKWPKIIRNHTTKENEVILQYPRDKKKVAPMKRGAKTVMKHRLKRKAR
jgi:hypothetical protein